MKISQRTFTVLALACAGAPLLSAGATAAQAPAEVVEYTFQEAPINSQGIGSLAALRGKPVLIDFWGTR